MARNCCCFCLDLRWGSLAIGIIHAVISASAIAGSGVRLALLRAACGCGDLKTFWFEGPAVPLIGVALFTVMLIFDVLLILGVLIDNMGLVMVWLFSHAVLLMSTFSPVVTVIMLLHIKGIGDDIYVCIFLSVLALIWIVLRWYFYSVVSRYCNHTIAAKHGRAWAVRSGQGRLNQVHPTRLSFTMSGGMARGRRGFGGIGGGGGGFVGGGGFAGGDGGCGGGGGGGGGGCGGGGC